MAGIDIRSAGIVLLGGIPFPRNYSHVWMPNNATEQFQTLYNSYSLAYARHYSFVRSSRNTIRIDVSELGATTTRANLDYWSLIKCNYIIFSNDDYLWNVDGADYKSIYDTFTMMCDNRGTEDLANAYLHYAFVTDVRYINQGCVEIVFEIDVMQTYMFQYEVLPCLVEREHVIDDTPFTNLMPENLYTGDYVVTDENVICSAKGKMMLTALTPPPTSMETPDPETPIEYNGFILPFHTEVATIGEIVTSMNAYISNGQASSIVSVYSVPEEFDEISDSVPTQSITKVNTVFPKLDFGNESGRPHNNKLYNYPFSKLLVSNGTSVTEFKWEDFDMMVDFDDQPAFMIVCTMTDKPNILCVPVDYKHVDYNYDYAVSYDNSPQVPLVTNEYANWLLQNQNVLAQAESNTVLQSVANGISTVLVGSAQANQIASNAQANDIYRIQTVQNPNIMNAQMNLNSAHSRAGLISTGVNALASIGTTAVNGYANYQALLAGAEDRQNNPPQLAGQINANMTRFYKENSAFKVKSVSARKEVLLAIDDYLDMYGYYIKRVKTPNRNSRRHWNYVKTIGCLIKYTKRPSGSSWEGYEYNSKFLYADHKALIESVYNNGVTFWKNVSEIGNYSLDNTI